MNEKNERFGEADEMRPDSGGRTRCVEIQL